MKPFDPEGRCEKCGTVRPNRTCTACGAWRSLFYNAGNATQEPRLQYECRCGHSWYTAGADATVAPVGFRECAACAAKPGSPVLCSECQARRAEWWASEIPPVVSEPTPEPAIQCADCGHASPGEIVRHADGAWRCYGVSGCIRRSQRRMQAREPAPAPPADEASSRAAWNRRAAPEPVPDLVWPRKLAAFRFTCLKCGGLKWTNLKSGVSKVVYFDSGIETVYEGDPPSSIGACRCGGGEGG